MPIGIYHVRFSSSIGGVGEGLVVIKDGAVNGGDAGYLYTGSLTENAGNLSGRLTIKRWNPGHVSVFGPLDSFELQLHGQGNPTVPGTFFVTGGIPQQPNITISIEGRFLSVAA